MNNIVKTDTNFLVILIMQLTNKELRLYQLIISQASKEVVVG